MKRVLFVVLGLNGCTVPLRCEGYGPNLGDNMRLYSSGHVPTLGILVLISVAVSPIELPAQGPALKPPGEVVRAYRKMDSEGGRLTTNGWYRAARFFVKPPSQPRYRIVVVMGGEVIEEHPRIIGNRTKVGLRRDELGQIDSAGRFTSLVAPSLLDSSGHYRKKPWGPELHGPVYVGGHYELVLTDTYWEFTPGREGLREVRGAPEWRIENFDIHPLVTVPAAIRYLTRLRDDSDSEVIKRNVKNPSPTFSVSSIGRRQTRCHDKGLE